MKRVLAVAATAAAAVGGATLAGSAIGQGTGGTVGPRATGTLEVLIRFADNNPRRSGINPAVPRNKRRPKVMDIHGGTGAVISNGRRVGRTHNFDVTTFEGARRYRGGAEAISNNMLDFGGGNLLFASCRSSDDPRSNPCAITGGTGDFAGARGTGVVHFPPVSQTRKAAVLRVTFTFIP